MKILTRIGILLIVALLFFYYTGNRVKENKPLESPVKQGTAVPVLEKGVGSAIPQTSRPELGLSVFVGDKSKVLIEAMGEPDRIEPSGYGYDWWIYFKNQKFMASVTDDNIVNQVYAAEMDSDISPFQIGQNISDIYRFTIVGSEIDVQLDDNIYTFSLNSEDLQTRLLIIYKGLYVQLYIDKEDKELEAVRFIDPTTLVLHQPYEMTYMGELLASNPPSSIVQVEVDRTVERQVFELTNLYRLKHGVQELKSDYKLTIFAREHSKMMALENYMADENTDLENLSKRLKEAEIDQKQAGENIAFDYVDAIEAVHGWLNSPAHRKVLLDKDFTHMGAGAYGNYYTQDFIKATKLELRSK